MQKESSKFAYGETEEKHGDTANPAPAKPRRARNEDTSSKHEGDGSKTSNDIMGGFIGGGRRKRSEVNNDTGGGGGWMVMSSAAPVSRRDANSAGDNSGTQGFVEEDDTKDSPGKDNKNNKDKHFQGDDNDEIILIPDLDEEGGADSDQRIAHAPRNITRKIPTLNDLETAVKAAASSIVDAQDGTSSLNLNILLSTLIPVNMVHEDDSTWSFDSLLREITDELTPTPRTVISVVSSYGESASDGRNKSSTLKSSDNSPGSPAKKLDNKKQK